MSWSGSWSWSLTKRFKDAVLDTVTPLVCTRSTVVVVASSVAPPQTHHRDSSSLLEPCRLALKEIYAPYSTPFPRPRTPAKDVDDKRHPTPPWRRLPPPRLSMRISLRTTAESSELLSPFCASKRSCQIAHFPPSPVHSCICEWLHRPRPRRGGNPMTEVDAVRYRSC